MPRARISEASEDIVLSKPRARKPRAISVEGVVSAPVRKRAAPRPRVTPAATVISEPAPRKAPTPLAARRRSHSKNTKAVFVVIFICLVLAGSGVAIGFMDKGSIDVVAVVNERNEKINKGEVRDEAGNAITETIQVQTDSRPNGGLPMGDVPVPPIPAPAAASSTAATSTSEQATTSTETIDSEVTATGTSI